MQMSKGKVNKNFNSHRNIGNVVVALFLEIVIFGLGLFLPTAVPLDRRLPITRGRHLAPLKL